MLLIIYEHILTLNFDAFSFFKFLPFLCNLYHYQVAKLIDSVESSLGSEMDLSSKIYCLTSAIITRVAFGKSAFHEEFLALQKSASALFTGFNLIDLFPSMKCVHLISGLKAKLEKMHKRIDIYLEDIIKKTQENRQTGDEGGKGISGEESETFLETLLRIKESGSLEIPFTANNIKAIIWVSLIEITHNQ